jgi:TolB-like protein/class 3 adenylate cyclase/Tfp pilus assembly protein PilF
MDPKRDPAPQGEAASAASIPAGSQVWRFANACLDESRLELRVGGVVTALEPKPLELLMFLLRRPGEVATKDQILEALWPGRLVTEASLTKCVAKLRQALGDSEQFIVRTVHGFGYRFGVPVSSEALPPPSAAPAPAVPGRSGGARRLVAIMFTDIVGYTELVQADERRALRLLEAQRAQVRRAAAEFGGRVVEVIGDAFLVEFPSALQAVDCALAIQQALARSDDAVRLRIGVHLGDIERVGKGLFGDSVNIAARIQGAAPHGGLAISAPVHGQVHNKVGVAFRSLGPVELKGVQQPTEVLVADAAALAAAPAPQANARRRVPAIRAIAAGVALVAIVAGAGLLARFPASAPQKSVAVMPFKNQSENAQNAYFADGVQESILTLLAGIEDLDVISHTSSLRYRDSKQPLAEIAAELGVAYVVEGSVQRHGDRVRVAAQLIAVEGDRQVWGETFDRKLEDVFAIQSEIAREIASAVHAAMTPRELQRIAQAPTASAQAYDLYIQALHTGVFDLKAVAREALLRQALALDPQFAMARARLAITHTEIYWWGLDASARRLEMARAEAQAAQQLDPTLAEVHDAWGSYYYRGFRDYGRAINEWQKALEQQPNSATILGSLAAAKRRLGRWDESVADSRRALRLDPHNLGEVRTLAETLEFLRRYEEADALYERWIRGAPQAETIVHLWRAYNRKVWKADVAFMRQTVARPPSDPSELPFFTMERTWLARVEKRFADGIGFLEGLPSDWIPLPGSHRCPRQLEIADLQALMDDSKAAAKSYGEATRMLEDEVRERPLDARAWEFLAWARAGLGDRAGALAAIQRATEMMPPARDALVGPDILVTRAKVLMMLGDVDGAVAELAHVVSIPSHHSAQLFAIDPVWQRLWDHPGFRKLLEAERRA